MRLWEHGLATSLQPTNSICVTRFTHAHRGKRYRRDGVLLAATAATAATYSFKVCVYQVVDVDVIVDSLPNTHWQVATLSHFNDDGNHGIARPVDVTFEV